MPKKGRQYYKENKEGLQKTARDHNKELSEEEKNKEKRLG